MIPKQAEAPSAVNRQARFWLSLAVQLPSCLKLRDLPDDPAIAPRPRPCSVRPFQGLARKIAAVRLPPPLKEDDKDECDELSQWPARVAGVPGVSLDAGQEMIQLADGLVNPFATRAVAAS